MIEIKDEPKDDKKNTSTPPAPVWSDERKTIIRAWFQLHAKNLLIESHEITLTFHDEAGEDRGGVASTSANFPYRTGHAIHLYPRWLEYSEHGQEMRVIHELLHVVLDPLYDLAYRSIVKDEAIRWRHVQGVNEALIDHLAVAIAAMTIDSRPDVVVNDGNGGDSNAR